MTRTFTHRTQCNQRLGSSGNLRRRSRFRRRTSILTECISFSPTTSMRRRTSVSVRPRLRRAQLLAALCPASFPTDRPPVTWTIRIRRALQRKPVGNEFQPAREARNGFRVLHPQLCEERHRRPHLSADESLRYRGRLRAGSIYLAQPGLRGRVDSDAEGLPPQPLHDGEHRQALQHHAGPGRLWHRRFRRPALAGARRCARVNRDEVWIVLHVSRPGSAGDSSLRILWAQSFFTQHEAGEDLRMGREEGFIDLGGRRLPWRRRRWRRTRRTGTQWRRTGPGMFGGGAANSRFSLEFSVNVRNVFNVINLGPPVGNIGSPLFGQSNNVNGWMGYRHLDLQVRFNF